MSLKKPGIYKYFMMIIHFRITTDGSGSAFIHFCRLEGLLYKSLKLKAASRAPGVEGRAASRLLLLNAIVRK